MENRYKIMKSEVQFETKKEPLPYPKLMKRGHSDTIVLFFSEGIGVRLTKPGIIGKPEVFPDYEYAYEDFYGTVTLSN